LFFKVLHPFAHTGHSRFKFCFVNQSIGIAINQSCDPSAKLAHLGFQTFVLIGLLVGLQTLPIFLFQPFWFFKQSADFLPDCCIGLVHA